LHLKLRPGTKHIPVSALTGDKDGPKLSPTQTAEEGPHEGISMNPGRITGQRVSMRLMAQLLSGRTRRTVFDRTQIPGEFDVTLQWTPDPNESASLKEFVLSRPPDDTMPFPSLFTAIREQLGLKLDSAKGPVDFFFIEHAQKPAANRR